jgi:hypothetical protein
MPAEAAMSLTLRCIALLSLPLALAGCQRAPTDGAAVAVHGDYARQDWLLPSSPGAAQPDLVATPDGRLLLSWISNVPGRRNALQFAAWDDAGRRQGAPRTIAVGSTLLANWANTPRIAATADGALWVTWLQKTGDGHAADLMLSRSADGGFNWSAPSRVNQASGGEHGFASLWPASRDSIGVAWLDGPGMTETENAVAAPDRSARAGDATVLRAAVFDGNLRRSAAADVDTMACDCCQTDVAVTMRGALLVYRDRTRGEVRDIFATRFDGARWTPPAAVHADGWKMPGCPVNGPAVAADGANVVVAWYTGAADVPMVQLARSGDGGNHFAAPVVLDRGAAVQGRVALAVDGRQAWVAWVREDASGQSLWLARYAPDLSQQRQRLRVATLQGRGRATGFPQLALRGGDAHLVWTDVVDGAPQLRGAVVAR